MRFWPKHRSSCTRDIPFLIPLYLWLHKNNNTRNCVCQLDMCIARIMYRSYTVQPMKKVPYVKRVIGRPCGRPAANQLQGTQQLENEDEDPFDSSDDEYEDYEDSVDDT